MHMVFCHISEFLSFRYGNKYRLNVILILFLALPIFFNTLTLPVIVHSLVLYKLTVHLLVVLIITV